MQVCRGRQNANVRAALFKSRREATTLRGAQKRDTRYSSCKQAEELGCGLAARMSHIKKRSPSFEKGRPQEKKEIERELLFFVLICKKQKSGKHSFSLQCELRFPASLGCIFFVLFHHSLLLAWWRAIQKQLPVLFFVSDSTIAYFPHIQTCTQTHCWAIGGKCRKALTTSPLPHRAHTFHQLHSKWLFLFVIRPPHHLLSATQTYTRRETRIAVCHLYL